MSCVSFPRYGILLGSLTATALPAAPLSPADQNAIEQQQKALLEQTQQQRDMLRHSTSAPSLPEATPSEPDGQCFQLRHIRLENVTVLPRSAVRKLTTIPVQSCMTLPDRGFKEQYLSGNRGGYWRNELTWQWMTVPGVGAFSATGALDTRNRVAEGTEFTQRCSVEYS